MSEYFELPKKRKQPKRTKEQRRAYTGKSFAEVEKSLNGLPFNPETIRRQRTIIENTAWKNKNVY